MTLPGSPFLAWQGPDLCLDGVNLRELVRQHGSPLYVYSRQAMLAALAPYQKALQGREHLICYAVKANSNLAVLQTFAQAGRARTSPGDGRGRGRRCVPAVGR